MGEKEDQTPKVEGALQEIKLVIQVKVVQKFKNKTKKIKNFKK